MLYALTLATCIAFARSQSFGCGRSNSLPRGKSTDLTMTVDGYTRSYRVHVPSGYDPNEPAPLVVSFHGWGGTAAGDESYLGLSTTADAHGFFAVYPQGFGDYNNNRHSNQWGSWNAVGTTGAKGTECTSSTYGYCYNSCKSGGGCNKCSWTTCLDDVKFVTAIIDTMESDYCIDLERIHATGYSNGGQMAYQTGLSLAHRIASIVPGGGQPHVGHNTAPDISKTGYVSIMDLHGSRDRTCPANTTVSAEGWNYQPMDSVMEVWAKALNCKSPTATRYYPTAQDGKQDLYCVEFGDCGTGVDVVRCSYNLAHHWPGYNTPGGSGAQLAWSFMLEHPKKHTAYSRAYLKNKLEKMSNRTAPGWH